MNEQQEQQSVAQQLYDAAYGMHASRLSQLLRAAEDGSGSIGALLSAKFGGYEETALHAACKLDVDVVLVLLGEKAAKANLEVKDMYGHTPLSSAIYDTDEHETKVEIVKILVEHGANFEARETMDGRLCTMPAMSVRWKLSASCWRLVRMLRLWTISVQLH